MKLTITLSDTERDNIHGWVNYYAEPAHAAERDNPTRIVLEERTRARLDEITAQFTAAPVNIEAEVPLNGSRVVRDYAPGYIRAFPFRIPDNLADPTFNGAIAEYQTNPTIWMIAASKVAGDMAGAASGQMATALVTVGQGYAVGDLVYFNIRQYDGAADTKRGGFSVGGR